MQNTWNTTSRKNSTSKYRGVNYHKNGKYERWLSQICKGGIGYYLGYFKTEEAAARAYDAKAKELFGEFANLNFKDAV